MVRFCEVPKRASPRSSFDSSAVSLIVVRESVGYRDTTSWLHARREARLRLIRGDVVKTHDGERYEIIRELGRGAFGAVFRVADVASRSLALKMLKKTKLTSHEAEFSQMISEEFSRHDHIVHIFDVFESIQGSMCILMEYLPMSLQQYLDIYPTLELHVIRLITAGVLLGLYALKQLHLIHADIKPNNIMLIEANQCIRAKIIDFGICELSTEGPHVGLYIQAKPYRAPEVFLGYEVTHAIDIWSFGVCATEMCIGGALFDQADTTEAFRSILWQIGVEDVSYIENAPNRDRFFEPAEDGCLVFIQGSVPGNAAKLDRILMRKLRHHRKLSPRERIDFVDMMVKMVCFDHRSRMSVEEALLQNFITMRNYSGTALSSTYKHRHLCMLNRSCPTLFETTEQIERLNAEKNCTRRMDEEDDSTAGSTSSDSPSLVQSAKRLKARHDKYKSNSRVGRFS